MKNLPTPYAELGDHKKMKLENIKMNDFDKFDRLYEESIKKRSIISKIPAPILSIFILTALLISYFYYLFCRSFDPVITKSPVDSQDSWNSFLYNFDFDTSRIKHVEAYSNENFHNGLYSVKFHTDSVSLFSLLSKNGFLPDSNNASYYEDTINKKSVYINKLDKDTYLAELQYIR